MIYYTQVVNKFTERNVGMEKSEKNKNQSNQTNSNNGKWPKILLIGLGTLAAIVIIILVSRYVCDKIVANHSKVEMTEVNGGTDTFVSTNDATTSEYSALTSVGKDGTKVTLSETDKNKIEDTDTFQSQNTGTATEIANMKQDILDTVMDKVNERVGTVVQGAKGETGEQGEKGEDGKDGKDGDVGAKGETGARGETGSRGATGAKGETGATGKQGATGNPGTNGKDGKDGKDGVNGKSTFVAYASNADGSGFSLTPVEGKSKYIGTCMADTQPTDPSAYNWQPYTTYTITSYKDDSGDTVLLIN